MKVHSIQPKARRAFTLLELLIVVAIIALLMSLSVVVMLGFLNQAEEEATNATIQKINKILEQRIEAFDRAFVGARRTAAIANMQNLLSDPDKNGNKGDGIFGVKDASVVILAKKAAFRFEFPQRIADILDFAPFNNDTNTNGVPDNIESLLLRPTAEQQLRDGYDNVPPNPNPSATDISNRVNALWAKHVAVPTANRFTESSEFLYFALIKSTSYGSASVDDDRFTQNEIRDTDGDGMPEFVDAWGQPLRFYRWPTRLIDTRFVDGTLRTVFQPDFANLNDDTDLAIDTNGDGTIDVGKRRISSDGRIVANMLLKGLPPAPSILPNNALPRDMLLIDPDDRVGRLYAELEYLDGTGGKPELKLEFNETKYHTPDTFHAPLIMSIGPDERSGLYEPTDTVNAGHLGAYNFGLGVSQIVEDLSDNITSRNKVSGGRQ